VVSPSHVLLCGLTFARLTALAIAEHEVGHDLRGLLLHLRDPEAAYTSSVNDVELWPNLALTVFAFAPEASSNVAWVWRKSCTRSDGSFAARTRCGNRRLTAFGVTGEPSSFRNTSPRTRLWCFSSWRRCLVSHGATNLLPAWST
jgi:hypothetical protein